MGRAAPEVAVVCAAFNAEAFLADAIESVRGQSFTDWEMVIVDDGSTDGTSEIIARYEGLDPRIRGLRHPGGVNRGLSPSRNTALRATQAPFVAFIDADDLWRPEKLAEQLAILQAELDASLVCGAVNYWSSWNGGADVIRPTGLNQGLVLAPQMALDTYPLGEGHAPTPSDIMVRRTVVEAVGGFEESFVGKLMLYEDQAFLAKIYLLAGVWISGRTWLDYRQHEQSMMHSLTREGHYRAVRKHFFDWYGQMLETHGAAATPALRAALRRARAYEASGLVRFFARARRKMRTLLAS